MFDNTPKMTHVAFFAFVGIAFIAAIGYTKNEQIIYAFKIAAWVFLIVAAVLMGLVVWEERIRSVQVMIDWMHEFGRLDDEARAAVAFAFPTMRYKMKRGEVRGMFEDTNVTIDQFRLFLQTSNSQYISPRRDWYTADKPEWAWLEIQGWLLDNEHIIPDSAAGSHSWLWNGNAYQHLTAYWMAGRKIPDMNRVYAYDLPTPPPLEEAGGGSE